MVKIAYEARIFFGHLFLDPNPNYLQTKLTPGGLLAFQIFSIHSTCICPPTENT